MSMISGYTCYFCGQYVSALQSHNCQISKPYNQFPGNITTQIYGKTLAQYSLQELLDELKRRKNAQDVKVKELEKEVELQKQLDSIFPEEK